jgi:alpha-N-arabinofuranosidase
MRVAAWGMAALLTIAPAQAQIRASATVDTAAKGTRIAPEIYGQFAEQLGTGINGGIWVGEGSAIPNIRGYRSDVVAALKALKVPVVRWPGGCYGDIYHWRDGIGPRDKRPVTLNKWWGNTEEANQFGTHEFFEFAELIGAKTYLNVNAGSATPGEARQWVEYVSWPGKSAMAELRRANGRDKPWKLDYVGVGNEMWGCGGNLKADEWAGLYRRFATFLKGEGGAKLIAAGPTGGDYKWTEALMETAREQLDAISLHYYTLPTGDWGKKGAAIGFDEAAWVETFTRTRKLEEYVRGHDAVMDKHDPDHKLGLMVAEWGSWYDATPGTNSAFLQQENSLRDALLAGVNLNMFHRHADRVHMANIAQMVNVLQAMILTDGAKMVLTPTYHAFRMYQPFQGASALPVAVQAPDYAGGAVVDVTAARGSDGAMHVALVNLDPKQSAEVSVAVPGSGTVSGEMLTGPAMDSRNTFAAPEALVPQAFRGAKWQGGRVTMTLPAKSLVVLKLATLS